MTDYRRWMHEGGIYFFTVVTYRRSRILTETLARESLRAAIENTRSRYPFEVVAWCLLPDHLHCVWALPADDCDFSRRWAMIKVSFTQQYLSSGGCEHTTNLSRNRKRERGLWQRRFWEHRIRDERDFQQHVNYIHYNPVKHGLVEQVDDWPWSTYHRYIREGVYQDTSWQTQTDSELPDMGE